MAKLRRELSVTLPVTLTGLGMMRTADNSISLFLSLSLSLVSVLDAIAWNTSQWHVLSCVGATSVVSRNNVRSNSLFLFVSLVPLIRPPYRLVFASAWTPQEYLLSPSLPLPVTSVELPSVLLEIIVQTVHPREPIRNTIYNFPVK